MRSLLMGQSLKTLVRHFWQEPAHCQYTAVSRTVAVGTSLQVAHGSVGRFSQFNTYIRLSNSIEEGVILSGLRRVIVSCSPHSFNGPQNRIPHSVFNEPR